MGARPPGCKKNSKYMDVVNEDKHVVKNMGGGDIDMVKQCSVSGSMLSGLE